MCDNNDIDECINYENAQNICKKCWKGTLLEAEMHIFLRAFGSDEDTDPFITYCLICSECQNITDLSED